MGFKIVLRVIDDHVLEFDLGVIPRDPLGDFEEETVGDFHNVLKEKIKVCDHFWHETCEFDTWIR